MTKAKAKAKSAAKKAVRQKKVGPAENPKLPAGANRRAMASLTIKLSDDLARLEEQKRMIGRQEKRILDQYKKDTGRSKGAAKKMIQLYRMDPTVRDTMIRDMTDIATDLGMATDMPLFAEAVGQAGLAADLERERATPGFFERLGEQAFKDGLKMDDCPYPQDDQAGRDARDKWERGFVNAKEAKDKADWEKANPKAKAAAEAPADTKH